MANEENLIPITERSQEEAKRISKKGGIARGKQRTKEKALRETFEAMFDYIGKQRIEENPQFKEMIEDIGAMNFELARIITNPKGSDKTRLAALKESMDRMHGKPTQTVVNREGKPFTDDEDLAIIEDAQQNPEKYERESD